MKDRSIETCSLVYIIIPYLIFAFGWLKLPFAVILAVLVMVSTIMYAKTLDNQETFLQNKNLKYFLITILILLIWCLFSGMGGFGFQNNPDWEKNNAIFHDLFFYKWPVMYKDYTLVYYMGYYLPAGLVMKLFGWNAGYIFSLIWGFLGLTLGAYWINRLCGKFSPLVILFFIFFSGLDIAGLFINQFSFYNQELLPLFLKGVPVHIEWWAGYFQFSSNTTSLFWVPQYAIQGWLLTGLILNNINNHKSSKNLLFLWALCVFGVPFIFIAITPIILAGIYKTKAKDLFTFQNFIASPVIVFVIISYFTSKAFKDAFYAGSDFMFTPAYLIFYLFFIVMEFVLYALVINKYFKDDIIWNVNLLSMLAMPFIRIGGANDFVMRGSLCYLFILFIYIMKSIFEKTEFKRPQKFALLAIFLIGAVTPYLEIKRSVINYSAKVPALSKQMSVMDLKRYRNNSQYLGDKNAFFWKYLAK